MSVQLLDKTRKINKLLHNNHSHRVEFNDICEVLSGILESNILVISQKGKILGAASYSGIDKIGELITADTGGFVDNMLNERLLGVLSTKENVNLLTLGFSGGSERKFKALIAPVDIAGERLGTLFIYKCVADYDIDDIILCEYGATVVGLEMMSSVNNENAEDERKKKIVKSAIKTLSASELQAVKAVFAHMDGMDGILVASRIADDTGITRSVIVNALKKFDSAGVISTKSSGMKGTKIKVLNEVVYDELKKHHLIMSEYPFDTKISPRLLPASSRILAGLANDILVTQLNEKDFEMMTIQYALEQGKDIYSVPAAFNNKLKGTNKIIEHGAYIYNGIESLESDYNDFTL